MSNRLPLRVSSNVEGGGMIVAKLDLDLVAAAHEDRVFVHVAGVTVGEARIDGGRIGPISWRPNVPHEEALRLVLPSLVDAVERLLP